MSPIRNRRHSMNWMICLLLQFYLCGVAVSLRNVQLWVPEAVRGGSSVKLTCDYDLEKEFLYSIKWYRADEEFYRFVPKESPPTRVFPLPGIHVDINLSDSREVTLLDVSKELTGFYKCEVSADAPLFHTDIKSAFMTVVETPPEDPVIAVDKLRYSAGERIRANCTARSSYPAANITWFVNGHRVPESSPTVVTPDAGDVLETVQSSLELDADSATFSDSKLKLWCVATLFNVYHQRSEEVELHEDTPQIASVLGPSITDASLAPESSVELLVLSSCACFLVKHR